MNVTPSGKSPDEPCRYLMVPAVTVVDDVRMRSEPFVGPGSVKYVPTLRKGTPLIILDGPVQGSGYDWFHVLLKGTEWGWVAAADHDGTPWIKFTGPGCHQE